jgi:hypothetical protein
LIRLWNGSGIGTPLGWCRCKRFPCANASLFASEAGGLMTINGITQQGATLTLELDSLSVGTHAMTETNNTIL